MRILSDVQIVARKHYLCDACRALHRSNLGKEDMSAADRLIVEAAMANGWRILAGSRYRKIKYADCGQIWTYRARIDMDDLCQRHELFDE